MLQAKPKGGHSEPPPSTLQSSSDEIFGCRDREMSENPFQSYQDMFISNPLLRSYQNTFLRHCFKGVILHSVSPISLYLLYLWIYRLCRAMKLTVLSNFVSCNNLKPMNGDVFINVCHTISHHMSCHCAIEIYKGAYRLLLYT